ncbi:MAG: prohibitin 1, partial [Flammeovirgaceae bacterium]
ARKVIGRYDPEELYSSKRDVIQEEIFTDVKNRLKDKNIYLDAILIRGIELPPNIKMAIEKKLKQEQESQEYEFKIEKEKKEAERKRIEAQGIKDFQDIVSEGISDKLLRWKGIEATLSLAQSPNSKVVVIGQGDDGLPLILGGNSD